MRNTSCARASGGRAGLQDDDLRVRFQGWTGAPYSVSSWQRSSSTVGDTMSYHFTGTSVVYAAVAGPNEGIARVTLDGASRGVRDLYALTISDIAASITGLASTAHTLTMTVTGTANPASSGTAIALLGFDTVLQPDLVGSDVSIGGRTTTKATGTSGGTYRSATAAGRIAGLSFTGTGATWITQTCAACGKAQVSIDGGAPANVDLYSAATANKVLKTFAGLPSGPHSLTIRVLGQKRAAATGTKVVVDAFTVQP